MSLNTKDESATEKTPGLNKDVHGEAKLAQNVLTNWGAQVFQMLSGFIIPRLIDRQLSQEALGVWDLAWSIVVYFTLIQMGVTSSINRFVAFNRAKSDFEAINRVASSITVVMRGMGLVVLGLTIICALNLDRIFPTQLGGYLPEARWVVFILGMNMAVQISATVYSSILTGCHRWDYHNGIQAGTNIFNLIGMLSVLLLGKGLIALALVSFFSELLGRIARVMATYRLCPWLMIRTRLFHWETARGMLSFGGKTFVTQLSQLIMNSSVNLLIAAYLGPAVLALYARPHSLVRNLGVFINKYAMVFSPTISSLQGAGKHAEVIDLSLKATRYGLFLSLPALLFLFVFGGEVLRLWMGASYANQWLVSLVVLAFLSQISHIPLFKALVGLNFHGQPGLVNLIAALITVAASYCTLAFFDGGIVAVALCVASAVTLTNGIYLPAYACRKLNITLRTFWMEVWQAPVMAALPYLACLCVARAFLGPGLAGAGTGAGLGCVVLFILYWRTVFPDRLKQRIITRFPSSFRLKSV